MTQLLDKRSAAMEEDASQFLREIRTIPRLTVQEERELAVREERVEALRAAADWDDRVLVEERIYGRELTVGNLDGDTLPAVEIIPTEGFYDYKNKYQGSTIEICPAEIPEAVAAEAAELTRRAFDALHLSGYARIDYLLDREDRLWCLEANTLPGMTPTSLLPQAAAAVGINYNQLCERIVEVSLKKKLHE